jgi:hypothetical protein
MKTHFTGFLIVTTLIFAVLGGMQAVNIVRHGLDAVPLIMSDAHAGALREQQMFLAAYNASAEPLTPAEIKNKKK